MPVTFGTVEVIPQSAVTPASSGAATERTAPPAIDPRDLVLALRQLDDRHARVRAH